MSDRKYKLYSDSTCDLSEDILKNMDVTLLELSFEVNGVVKCKNDMTLPEFYSQMRNGAVTKTSQIGISDYEQAFEKELAAGYDVLYLGFSSGLSGSFNTSCIARDSVMEKYPEGKIICIDSLCASTGEGLLLIKADEKKKQGLSIDELAQWITDNRLHLCHVFTVDDLKYLHRGGRVSKTAAIAGSILGIKQLLHVDNEGHLIPVGKIRGRKQSIEKLVDMMCERMGNWRLPFRRRICSRPYAKKAWQEDHCAYLLHRCCYRLTLRTWNSRSVLYGRPAIKIQYKSGRSPKTSSAIFICDIKDPLPFSKLYHYLQAG